MDQNPLIGLQGIQAAACLNWPNLTEYVQHVAFPTLKTPILIIAEEDPLNAYGGILATYNYLGIDNAILLTHDGIGHGWNLSPNNCTLNAIKELYRDGQTPK